MLFIYYIKTCKDTINNCFSKQVTNIKLNVFRTPSKIRFCNSLDYVSPFLDLPEWDMSPLKSICTTSLKSGLKTGSN